MITKRTTKYHIWILILTTNLLFSQGISFEKIYPTNGVSYGWDVIEKNGGGFLVVGSITPFSTSVLVMNVDINGNLIWEKHIVLGLARSVTHADSNNYILAGKSVEGIIIIKINSDGDTLWTKIINNPTDVYATKIINTADGGYAIAGWIRSNNTDIYLIKTDGNCDTLWTKSYGEYELDKGYDIRELPDNGFILGGTTYGGYEPDYYSVVYVVRTDSIGSLLWSKRYYINGDAVCGGIVAAIDGGFVLTGSTWNEVNYSNDLFLLKINANGDSLWTKTYGDQIPRGARSIQLTIDGGYILTGAGGILKTDSNGNIIWLKIINGTGLSVKQTSDEGYIVSGVSESNYDILLVKTRKDGPVNVEEVKSIPYEYTLSQNYPNPFNPVTVIKYEIPGQTQNDNRNVQVKVYDILGKEIATLVNEEKPAGGYEVEFNGVDLPSGIYIYRLTAGKFTASKKLILLK